MSEKVIDLKQRKKQIACKGMTPKDILESGKCLYITITDENGEIKKYRMKKKPLKGF